MSAIEDTGEIKVNPIRKIISFKIDNPEGMYTDFQAYERMTWDEWVSSDFNTDGYIIEDDFVVDTWSGNIVLINDEKQMKYNIIIKDFNYSLSQPIKLITFYIENTALQCIEGMTWYEFIDSEYNTIGLYKEVTDHETVAGPGLNGKYEICTYGDSVIKAQKVYHYQNWCAPV